MGGEWREFRSRGKQRRQVEDQIDLEFREDAFQKPAIGNRAREFTTNQAGQRRLQGRDVERDNRAPIAGETRQQAVADFAVGARYEN